MTAPVSRPGPSKHHAYEGGPRLLADIGANKARFTLEHAPGQYAVTETLDCNDHPGLIQAVNAYLAKVAPLRPTHGAFALATPIDGDHVQMTNRPWSFSIEETRRSLNLKTLLVVNDFTALAMSLPYLEPHQRLQIGGGQPTENGVMGLIGPGTGLGVSGLIPVKDEWATLGSEGGHVSFAPSNEQEMTILRRAWQEWPHVSVERLVSGTGIELIYRIVADTRDALPMPQICERALGGDPKCGEALECFFGMLGTIAADLALTLGTSGGIYIGGRIVPRLSSLFATSSFRHRFETKGRLSNYLKRTPTYLITAQQSSLIGAGILLDAHLRRITDAPSLLFRVRESLGSLPPAEHKVGEYLLDQPQLFLHQAIAAIARNAGVSQPTVIRFCRNQGFDGLSTFKLALASSIHGTVHIRHSLVSSKKPTSSLMVTAIEKTASDILSLKEQVREKQLLEIATALRNAKRIYLFSDDECRSFLSGFQKSLLKLGILAVSYKDDDTQRIATHLLSAGDVVIAVSISGTDSLLTSTVQSALANGASVFAITSEDSLLAHTATRAITFASIDASKHISVQVLADLLAANLSGDQPGAF